MIVLTIRSDNPTAEIGLFDSQQELAYIKWQAHRELAETIHSKIREILNKSSKSLNGVEGIVCYKGPGSFTGLRIGLSVANALAYSLEVPIVSATGDDWIKRGVERLSIGEDEKIAMPEYGAPIHVSEPRK